MKKNIILGLSAILFLIVYSEGLQCWTCENQPSMFHCMFRGEIKTCLPNQDSCRTKVRKCGPVFAFFKGCKQSQACLTNARNQVTPLSGGIRECDVDQDNYVCSCCCQEERCNLNSDPCNGMQFACQPRDNLFDGNIACTNGSEVGSVCTYTCNQPGFEVFPVQSRMIECLNYGEWSQPLPCCARSCPRTLFNDILFLYQTTTEEMFESFRTDLEDFANRIDFGNDSAQVGYFSYGNKLNLEDAIFFNQTAAQDNPRFINRIGRLSFINDTGDEVLTGEALTYAFETFFTQMSGERPTAKNVVVLHLTNVSTDNVTEIAKTLREEGFEIYVVAPAFNFDPIYEQHLIDIAGSLRYVLFRNDLRQDNSYIERLVTRLCQNPCRNID